MLNFDNICRTCSLQGELQSLFGEDILNPAEMLTQIVDMKVIKDDKYPQNICTRCLDTLKSAYLFKNQCQDAYKKFEQYLSLNSETIKDCKEEIDIFIKTEKQSDNSGTDDEWFEIDNNSGSNIDEKPYKCEKCSSQFKNQKNYERHLKSHDQLNMCPICGDQFSNKYILKQHSLKHTEEKPYQCEKCSVQFKYKKNYKRHLKKHEQLYVCPICGDRFTSKINLEQHSGKHFNEKPNVEYLEKSSQHKPQVQCHVTLKRDGDELLKVTGQTVPRDKITQKRRLLCDYCGRGYHDASKLNAHIRTHTGEKPYACSQCDKTFSGKALLRQHRRVHLSVKPYKCNFCEKSFRMSHCLKGHLRIHTNDKPYACDICNQKFREKHHLSRHKFIHTGEKPFSCNVCNKQFTQNSNLRTHMRTHTGEKPYVCLVCGKSFHDSSSMKNHRKKHLLFNNEETQNVSSVSNTEK